MRFKRREREEEKDLTFDDVLSNGIKDPTMKPEVVEIYNSIILSGMFIWERLTGGNYSDTVIFLCPYAGTGDVYLAAMYMNAYAEKNNIDDFMVVVIGASNYKIISLFDFKKKEKVTQEEADNLVRLSMFLGEHSKKIHIIHHDSPQEYCGILENMRNINGLHFMDLYINGVFGAELIEKKEQPKFDYSSSEIKKIFKENGLIEGKTVILSPYVTTLPALPDWVWVDIAQELSKKGYIVATNCGKDTEPAVKGTIPLRFGYDISVPLIERCGYFIGIRSGFCDVISTAKCRKIIIYQPYLFWGDGDNYDYFCMNKIGFCDDAIEFSYEGIKFCELVERVVRNVEAQKPEITYKTANSIKKIEYALINVDISEKITDDVQKKNNYHLTECLNLVLNQLSRLSDKKCILIMEKASDHIKSYIEFLSSTCCLFTDSFKEALDFVPAGKAFIYCESGYVPVEDEIKSYDGIKNRIWIERISNEIKCLVIHGKEMLKNDGEELPDINNFKLFLSQKDKHESDVYEIKSIVIDTYDSSDSNMSDSYYTTIEKNGLIIKKSFGKEGKKKRAFESEWYKKAYGISKQNLRSVISFEPLIFEKPSGVKLYEKELTNEEKQSLLIEIIDTLKKMHALKRNNIFLKDETASFVNSLLADLDKMKSMIPFADEKYIIINSHKCKNVFFCKDEIAEILEAYKTNAYSFIHGSCTLDNMIVSENNNVTFPDPGKSYFSDDCYGETVFDWSLLYLSLFGGGISIQKREYSLEINDTDVKFDIANTGWDQLETILLKEIREDVSITKLKLFHALNWFVRCTDKLTDYNAMCVCFYRGVYILNELL